MPGFLNDLSADIAKVEANPNFIPDGLYPAFVFNSEIKDTKNGKQWVVTFKIAPESPIMPGKQKTVFLQLVIPDNDPDREFKLSLLKRMALDLGIPESRIAEFMPNEVVGSAVDIRIKNNKGYSNITEVKLRSETGNFTARASVPSSVTAHPAPNGDALAGLM